MDQNKPFIGGISAQDVDPAQIQDALFNMLKQAGSAGAPALDTMAQLQQRRAVRLGDSAELLQATLGKDHPDVLAAQAMATVAADLKTQTDGQSVRLKKWPKPRAKEWIVFGTVVDAQGEPAAGLTVRVFDRDRKLDDLLGETESDEAGDFSVTYHQRDFKETRENLPELYVMVSDAKGQLLFSSLDSLRYEGGQSEYFAIRLGAAGRTTKKKDAAATKVSRKKS